MLAIGDIHGCDKALERLSALVQPAGDYTVVVLGDLIDRGPNSKGVIDQLLQLSRTVNLRGIMGNHDKMLLESLERGSPQMLWIGAGAMATLDSYGGSMDQISDEHIQFIRSLTNYWQNDTHIFVHANVDPDVPMGLQHTATLRWSKLTGDEVPHCSGKTVICGHTSLAGGRPSVGNGFVCIDTNAYGGQWLTCLDVKSNLVWQANQPGESRGPDLLSDVGVPFASDQS